MTETHHPTRFGVFELDVRAGELRKNGVKIKLQDQPFQILQLLLERPGEIVTREEIQQKLWPDGTFVDFEHSLNAAVKRLRDALDDSADNPRFVETLPRRGYKFIAPVDGYVSEENSPTTTRQVPGDSARWIWWLAGASFALLLLAVGLNVSGLRTRLFGGVAPGEITSIAVLPLENLSGDPEQDYFADGMTDALITELGKISTLRVISRQSVMRFKMTNLSLPEIAALLNVDAIIEGTALLVGDEVRITTQLIRAEPEQHLWAESYQRNLADVLRLQSEVARIVAGEIRITLTAAEESRLASSHTVNPVAYIAYLRGQQELNKFTYEGFQNATRYLEDTVRLAPDFADGLAALATAYNRRGEWWGDLSPQEARPVAKRYAQQALLLDPNNGQARVVLARITWTFDWNWSEADDQFKMALDLLPNAPEVHQAYANYLRWRGGRTEVALMHVQLAQALNPLTSMALAELAFHYRDTGKMELAFATARKAIAVDPNSPAGYFSLGMLHLGSGAPEKAIEVLEKADTLPDNPPPNLRGLGQAYAALGRRDEVLRMISRLKSFPSPQSYPISFLYGVLGEEEGVLEYFEKAYEERHPSIVWIKNIPKLPLPPHLRKPIDNPRWQAVYRKLNFPPPEDAGQAEN